MSYNSQVHSIQVSVTVLGDMLTIGGEYAQSLYSNPNYKLLYNSLAIGHTGFLTGTAMILQARHKDDLFSIDANFRKVENTFISAPAQGRTQDTSYGIYGPFLHETDRFNPVTGLFFDNYGIMPNSGEDAFTKLFLPPQLARATAPPNNGFFFNYLMPYNGATNASQPYGLATPNRTGYGASGSVRLLNGGIIPMAMVDLSSQLNGSFTGNTQPAETYTVFGVGAVLDLKALAKIPLRFNGGMQTRTVDNTSLSPTACVKFSSSQMNFGGQYQMNKDTLFYAGMKHINYSGILGTPLYGAYTDPLSGQMIIGAGVGASPAFTWVTATASPYMNQSYDIWAAGIRFNLTPSSDVEVNYGNQLFTDSVVDMMHYELDQTYVRFNLRF
jgi:hypothetical protein